MKYQNTWGTTVMVDKVVKQRKEDYVVGHTETGTATAMCSADKLAQNLIRSKNLWI